MLEVIKVANLISSFLDSGLFVVLQILGGIVSALFIWAIIVLARKNGNIERHIRDLLTAWNKSPVPKHKMMKRWESVTKRIKEDNPDEWRTAIFEADFMLDEILKKIGYKGATLDERLENIRLEQFPSLQDAWRAHRVTEFLAEDPSYPLSREVVDETVRIYRSIFTETGILL